MNKKIVHISEAQASCDIWHWGGSLLLLQASYLLLWSRAVWALRHSQGQGCEWTHRRAVGVGLQAECTGVYPAVPAVGLSIVCWQRSGLLWFDVDMSTVLTNRLLSMWEHCPGLGFTSVITVCQPTQEVGSGGRVLCLVSGRGGKGVG